MSGLLQRLAAQATGSGLPGVRAAARVRAAEPLGLGSETRVTAASSFERPLIDGRDISESSARLGDTSQRHATDVDEPAWQVASNPAAPASTRVPAATPRTSQVLVPAPSSPPIAVHVASPGTPPTEPHFPSPLLDLLPPSSSIRRPSTRAEAVIATTREPEPTEVHVHIGRIEITAEKVAPQVRAKPAATSPPMALGDYLAKRKRKLP